MKKLLIIALSLGLFTFHTNAQDAGKADGTQKVQRDRKGGPMNDLNLTADQKAQMKANREYTKQQREAILTDGSLTSEQRKERLQNLQKSQKDKMNSILSPDQRAKLQANKKDWNRKGSMKGKRNGGKMMKDLNLTDAQKSQMKANREAVKQQREAIKNDASLTQDQKNAKMKELHKSQKDKMNSILTADQKAKMQADKKNWKQHTDRRKGGQKMKMDSSKSNAS